MDRSISDENLVDITCVLTGGIHGKETNPNLPEQPGEAAEKVWRPGGRGGHPPRARVQS